MKIYTKTGDKGTTRLVDGSCVEKFNPRVEAYGTVDELNSYIGLIYSLITSSQEFSQKNINLKKLIFQIQNDLFVIGSLLATEKTEVLLKLPQISDEDVAPLEKSIDDMTEQLPPLKNFILPTGHIISSHFHIARTLCRRAERRATEVAHNSTSYDLVLIYLNRLSDFLFTAARFSNHITNTEDVVWKKK